MVFSNHALKRKRDAQTIPAGWVAGIKAKRQPRTDGQGWPTRDHPNAQGASQRTGEKAPKEKKEKKAKKEKVEDSGSASSSDEIDPDNPWG